MPEGCVVVWTEAAGYVWTDVKRVGCLVDWLVSGWCVCVCVCVCVAGRRSSYWQRDYGELGVQASVLTDNLPLRVNTLWRRTPPAPSPDTDACVFIMVMIGQHFFIKFISLPLFWEFLCNLMISPINLQRSCYRPLEMETEIHIKFRVDPERNLKNFLSKV